ncbi:hypothetical protein MD484_g113, partial [Candolleomyces efflorescens]
METPPAPLPATLANSLLFRTESAHSGDRKSPSPAAGLTAHSSPSRSPRRLNTDGHITSTDDLKLRVGKRIVVCCDGTWQDGIGEHRSLYTNVLRLARTIHHEDERFQPPIPQIVFYQSGIGTEKNFYSEYIEGTTGGSLADKVEEAYAFIAHNYNPGDEIFLFGFSRGAYTARMVAMFIGEIGVLDRKDMDHFAKIFICYQKLGKTHKPEETAKLKEELAPWCKADARGRMRADPDGDTFNIKCIGVFDTVGSLGVPESLTLRSKVRRLFGFKDTVLGEHIERAYQALALHEMRADFNCNKFEQSEKGRLKKQVLKQCWFTGAHSDVRDIFHVSSQFKFLHDRCLQIGGGYKEHDLADISLLWMAAQVGDILGLDTEYLSKLPQPVAPWGQQKPHDSKSGIFFLAQGVQRPIPSETNEITNEWIHPSVLEQANLYPRLAHVLENHPQIVCPLLPLEEEMKRNWPYIEDSIAAKTYSSDLEQQSKAQSTSVTASLVRSGSRFRRSIIRSFSVSRGQRAQASSAMAVEVEETEDDVVAMRVVETNKLKKARRQSTPAPTITIQSSR